MLLSSYGREESSWLASSSSHGLVFSWQFLHGPSRHLICIKCSLSLYFPRTQWTTIRDLSQCRQWKLIRLRKLLLSGRRWGFSGEKVLLLSSKQHQSSHCFCVLFDKRFWLKNPDTWLRASKSSLKLWNIQHYFPVPTTDSPRRYFSKYTSNKHTQFSHVYWVLAHYSLHSIPFLQSKSMRNTS